MPRKLTTETFREQLSKEHPELELLSEYNGNKNYVTVRCKIHDYTFNTKPNWLHKGTGCQKCYDDRRGETTRKTLDDAKNESIKVHGNKYDYSLWTEYKNNKEKFTVICPIHGEFQTCFNKHVSGKQGCPICAGKIEVTNEMFIEKARKVHGDKYDYSKVDYINNNTKVCIVCPIHGEFWQTPDKHINTKQGCPTCKSSKLVISLMECLNNNGIQTVLEKQFEWLGRQKLDIYLPEYNIGIECQGTQHFEPIKHFGGKDGLNKRIRLDVTKYHLCGENNLRLLYVIGESDYKKINKKQFLSIYTKENTFAIKDIENDNSILIENILND